MSASSPGCVVEDKLPAIRPSCKGVASFLQYLVDLVDFEETSRQLVECDRQLTSARQSLQLTEDERRRAACLGKLQYLQARLQAFEQRTQPQQQHQQPVQHSTSSGQSSATPSTPSQSSQPVELVRSSTTFGMRLTPSTHLLAQQERDRDIQQRRRRRAGRQLPAGMSGAPPLLGRSLQQQQQQQTAGRARQSSASTEEASAQQQQQQQRQPVSQTPDDQSSAPPPLPPPPPPSPPASTPQPPPLPDSVLRSAGFYKLGFSSSERGAAARPLDGRIDGQRASLQRQRQLRRNGATGGGDSSAASYLDGQARRFLRVTAPTQQQQQQQQQQPLLPPESIAVRFAMRDYERTFLQPRNPVNSPEPDAFQQL